MMKRTMGRETISPGQQDSKSNLQPKEVLSHKDLFFISSIDGE